MTEEAATPPPSDQKGARNAANRLLDAARNLGPGVFLSLTVAAAAGFLSDHYGAPAMLFALLIGMAFNFLMTESRCAAGVNFASKTLLRIGVALLGLRLSFADMAALGLTPVLGVAALVGLTVGSGVLLARIFNQPSAFGLLTGGAVAICGASAALALASVLPRRTSLERDTLFTVIGVTTLSTVAMVAYPIIARAVGFTEVEIGFLIGATIHDVAQVVGAGYSVSEEAGDLATFIKLQRVALLPIVLLLILAFSGRSEGADKVGLPWFVVAFVILAAVNSAGLAPESVRLAMTELSRWLLITAIAALGVKTSLKAIVDVGGAAAAIIVLETLFLLAAGAIFIHYIWT